MSGVAEIAEPIRQGGWHLRREGAVLLLSRRWPARFDLAAATVLHLNGGPVGRARLAHQIRQDIWRGLQGLRGFWPVVRIERGCDVIHVRAGGGFEGRVTVAARSRAEAVVEAILADPAHRARWLRHAAAGIREARI